MVSRDETLRDGIKKRATEFFSEGRVSQKLLQATALTENPNIRLFLSAVPWTIKSELAHPIKGFSETLYTAIKDIHAQLYLVSITLSQDIAINIGIDETRLINQKDSGLPFKFIKGGSRDGI